MKKEYIKPTLLVIKTEPSQILAGSQGDETGGIDGVIEGGEGTDLDGEIGDEYEPVSTKGGLWDDYTW